MECKECIFGNHERKTCYLEADCEVMHEWLRKHDNEVKNKAIDDLAEKIADWCDFCNGGMRNECVKDDKCKIYEMAEQLKNERSRI